MPLTDLVGECGQTKITKAKGTKKVPWHWDEVHEKAFDTVKATIAKDVVLTYPDCNKVFEVYTDTSSTQLGSVVTSLEGLVGQAFCDKRLGQLQVYIEIALLVIKYHSESPQQIT